MLPFRVFILSLILIRYGLCISKFDPMLPSIGSGFFDKMDNFFDVSNRNYDLQDDGYLDAREIALKYDFVFEEHSVETQDGYILGLHRVHGKNGKKLPSTAPTVLMMHGILGSSAPFILDGDKSPAGVLLSHGFDLWLGNIRGNRFSKRHTSLKSSDSRFWNYTYFETVFYDIPATVDYILDHVKKPYLHGVGYSQGGIILASLMTNVNPEYYNKRIRSLSFVACGLDVKKFKTDDVDWMLNYLASYSVESVMANPCEVLPHSNLWVAAAYTFCNKKSITIDGIRNLYEKIVGKVNDNNMDWERFPYYVAQAANGISSSQLLHFSKDYAENGGLSFFDFGAEENLRKYNQKTPPTRNVSKIDTNLLFLYGSEDVLMHKEAVLQSIAEVKNVKKVVEVKDYNHYDFLHSININEKVYDVVADFINSYL